MVQSFIKTLLPLPSIKTQKIIKCFKLITFCSTVIFFQMINKKQILQSSLILSVLSVSELTESMSFHLKITVNNIPWMQILECWHNLCTIEACAVFCEHSFPWQVEKELKDTSAERIKNLLEKICMSVMVSRLQKVTVYLLVTVGGICEGSPRLHLHIPLQNRADRAFGRHISVSAERKLSHKNNKIIKTQVTSWRITLT